MKHLFVISVFISLSYVYCECPRREDLHCFFYDTTCQSGSSLKNTYIDYKGQKCDGCQICYPDSAGDFCPQAQCPYDRIESMYPMDCAITNYPQKTWINGRSCDACDTFTKDCSDLSGTG